MTSIQDARLLFPGAAGCVYLENSARGLLPIAARDAALNYYDARIAGVAKETDPVFDAEKQACESFATLVGATHDEITLTRNVTDGLNILSQPCPGKRAITRLSQRKSSIRMVSTLFTT
jgi:selenocysteine lyase/cysteine desulfurase